MDTFDVPEFQMMPTQTEDHGGPAISTFVDAVLTSLFNHAPALMHAELLNEDQSKPVVWSVRPLKAGPEQKSSPIAVSDCRSHFRAALARFGHHYMKGQLYNGYSLLLLRQRGTTYRTQIYMSNGGFSGFWIKIYAGKEEAFSHEKITKFI